MGVAEDAGRPADADRSNLRRSDTRQLLFDLGMVAVVRPNSNRIDCWQMTAPSTKRNEIVWLFGITKWAGGAQLRASSQLPRLRDAGVA
jgi:hypothetical protein